MKCFDLINLDKYEQYTAIFEYILPNGKNHGRYIELSLLSMIDTCHTKKTARSYIDGCITGTETIHNDGDSFKQEWINLLNNIVTLKNKTENAVAFIRWILVQNPNYILHHTKEYKNDGEDYIMTLFNKGHKTRSLEYKGGVQNGLLTTYFERDGVFNLVKKEVEHYNIHKIVGKTRLYDYIKDRDGNLKKFLIYEADLIEYGDWDRKLNGKATTWSLKRVKGKIKYHILQEHVYNRDSQIGYVKDYKNGRLVKDIRYDGYCRHDTSDI